MRTEENAVAVESIVELAELIGLTDAHLDLKEHFPKDVPAGRTCGVFAGIGGGVHVPVGDGKLVEIASRRLRLDGKFEYLGFRGSAALEIELTGPGQARLQSPLIGVLNARVWREGCSLYYQTLDGPMPGTRIKQIFANAGAFSGAYVEFHVTLNDGKYGEVKYWFNKS